MTTQHARRNRAILTGWRRPEQRGHPHRRTETLGENNRRIPLRRTMATKHGRLRSCTGARCRTSRSHPTETKKHGKEKGRRNGKQMRNKRGRHKSNRHGKSRRRKRARDKPGKRRSTGPMEAATMATAESRERARTAETRRGRRRKEGTKAAAQWDGN